MKGIPHTLLYRLPRLGISAYIATGLLSSLPKTFAQAKSGNTVHKEHLEKENQELKTRLENLDHMMQKQDLGSTLPTNSVKALSDIQISGFVTASYFYDGSKPADRK